jgi:hypothetical protein
VPQLHKKWAQIEEDLGSPIAGKGGCPFHDMYPLAGRLPVRPADEPTLVMIEKGHFVGYFELEGEKGSQVAWATLASPRRGLRQLGRPG